MKLAESLRQGDLRDLVKKVFEIDSFKSKIGKYELDFVLRELNLIQFLAAPEI